MDKGFGSTPARTRQGTCVNVEIPKGSIEESKNRMQPLSMRNPTCKDTSNARVQNGYGFSDWVSDGTQASSSWQVDDPSQVDCDRGDSDFMNP
jgi:hypothetical protein